MPTIQTVNMLEQRITQQYKEGPWSMGNYTLGEEFNRDEDVDMSVMPPSAEGQEDWVFEEASPTSPSDELLDWGSNEDLEECVALPFLYPMLTKPPALLQHPSMQADYDLLYRCLGHQSKDVLSNAKSKMKGFHQDLQIPTDMPVCPGCVQGKMPASSHPPSATRVKAAFECIHSDLKSFPVESYHKYKYFVSFLDDFSLFAWIILLQDKASAILALKQFLAIVRNQYNTTIKEWMSDAGREYKSEAFLKTLKDMGISIKQSAPHTPQQNGCAEHLMHTLMDKVQSMQLNACLPQSWWEFAVLHATHVYHRMPLQWTKLETPYTTLSGEAPNISHL
jgi:transposase InsO family protein